MAAISPRIFFRVLAENVDLVVEMHNAGDIDENRLKFLIEANHTNQKATPEHTRRQLESLGIIEAAPYGDSSYELSQPMIEVMGWLTRRQRLSSAQVLRGHLEDLATNHQDMNLAIEEGDVSRASLALEDTRTTIERVRMLSDGNRESVLSMAQQLRSRALSSSAVDFSAVDRFAQVRRLWEQHLVPLRDLVSVDGEMIGLLDRITARLLVAQERFALHGPLSRLLGHARARIARLQRQAARDHHAAIVEVTPLYQRMQRESRWRRGASLALKRIREHGPQSLDLDPKLRLTRWRPQGLLSDEHLRARFANLADYEPSPPTPIAEAAKRPQPPFIGRVELRSRAIEQAPIDDVLDFVIRNWPLHSLGCLLRAYGRLVNGCCGPVRPRVNASIKRYRAGTAYIEAWPMMLMGMPK